MRMLGKNFQPSEVEGLRVLVVPSGIGEFQWSWTKLVNTNEKFAILALDGSPRRLHQFCTLHPDIEAFGWVGFDYSQIRDFQKFNELTTWTRVRELFAPGQSVFLACNPHLEAGNPLASWLPDLPTSYTYPIVYDEHNFREADRVLHDATSQDLLIGISCASYRGAAAWRTWEHEEWTTFLRKIQNTFPNAKFVLLGGAWDDLTSNVFDPSSGIRWQLDARGICPVGTTTFGGAMQVLTRLDAYIGFSSGLGHVAAHLCGCPVFMMWPDHEYDYLSRSWVNPELLENGMYVPSKWLEVETVYQLCEPFLIRAHDRKGAEACR